MPDWLRYVVGFLVVAGYIWMTVHDIDYGIRYRPKDRMYTAFRTSDSVPESVLVELMSKWMDITPRFTGPLRRLREDHVYTAEGSTYVYRAWLVGERRDRVLKEFYRYLTELGWSAQPRTEGGWDFRDGDWHLAVWPSGSLRYETRAELWREDAAPVPAAGEGER